jgi:uncharacterized protein (TIGR02246 family)
MGTDEQAIRSLVERWHKATTAGDVDAIIPLMAEDAVFLVAGKPPMKGRRAFEERLRALLTSHRLDSKGEVQDVEASGDLAYAWSVLTVSMTPLAGGNPVERSGNVLSIFHRQANGAWVLIRDANLLSAAS